MTLDPTTEPGAPHMPSRADRIGITIFMGAGLAIIVWSIVSAVIRIIEVAGGASTRVLAEFAGTIAQAPIGPGGAAVDVELDRAVLRTSELPTFSIVSIVLQQVAVTASIVVVVTCLLLLSRSLLKGMIFNRRNSWLVGVASIVGLLGAAAGPFFSNMAANGAFAAISGGDFENVVMTIDVLPYVLGAFIVAIIGTAFTIGERLQRDTTGLV